MKWKSKYKWWKFIGSGALAISAFTIVNACDSLIPTSDDKSFIADLAEATKDLDYTDKTEEEFLDIEQPQALASEDGKFEKLGINIYDLFKFVNNPKNIIPKIYASKSRGSKVVKFEIKIKTLKKTTEVTFKHFITQEVKDFITSLASYNTSGAKKDNFRQIAFIDQDAFGKKASPLKIQNLDKLKAEVEKFNGALTLNISKDTVDPSDVFYNVRYRFDKDKRIKIRKKVTFISFLTDAAEKIINILKLITKSSVDETKFKDGVIPPNTLVEIDSDSVNTLTVSTERYYKDFGIFTQWDGDYYLSTFLKNDLGTDGWLKVSKEKGSTTLVWTVHHDGGDYTVEVQITEFNAVDPSTNP